MLPAIPQARESASSTGTASHLLDQDAPAQSRVAQVAPTRLGEPGGAAGALVENVVLVELARQLTWNEQRAALFHYRTRDGIEVDAILETPDGRVIGSRSRRAPTVRARARGEDGQEPRRAT